MISIRQPGKAPETLETKPGDYRWHEDGTTDSVEKVGSTTYEATEIEWKYGTAQSDLAMGSWRSDTQPSG
jgi:hypothetical protein